MAKAKKGKKEVVDNFQSVPEEARSVYKVFIQDEGDDDMHVDISADFFSPDPGSAVYAFLHTRTVEELFSFPLFTMFVMTDSGEPKEVENNSTPKKPRERIVMIRLTANDANEFREAILDGDVEKDPEIAFSVKALKQGYRTNIAEYRMQMVESLTPKGSNKPQIVAFKVERVSEETSEFPLEIKARRKKEGIHYHMTYPKGTFDDGIHIPGFAKTDSPTIDGFPEVTKNATLFMEQVDEEKAKEILDGEPLKDEEAIKELFESEHTDLNKALDDASELPKEWEPVPTSTKPVEPWEKVPSEKPVPSVTMPVEKWEEAPDGKSVADVAKDIGLTD